MCVCGGGTRGRTVCDRRGSTVCGTGGGVLLLSPGAEEMCMGDRSMRPECATGGEECVCVCVKCGGV